MIQNPGSNEICDILEKCKTIAVLGISKNPSKISRTIAEYLIDNEYNVVGVNPGFSDAGGIQVYPTLNDVPFDIDIVNVFRRSETISEIIPNVLGKKPKVLWLQLGIRNNEAVKQAQELGIKIIQDKCIKIEHQKCSW